jgi:hypothetical protein
VLRFERRVVAAMTGATDLHQREEVEDFVAGTLSTMPEHLRAAVVLASVGMGTVARIADLLIARADDASDPVITRLGEIRFGPVRQYFRLFRSLALFAEHETSTEPSV